MIIVGRHKNGITINPLEYLLDDDGNEMMFETEEKAKDFLKEKGFTDDDIYWFTFKDIDEFTSASEEPKEIADREHPQEESQAKHFTGRSPLPFSPKRMEQLLDKALDWIGKLESGGELYNTLVEQLRMSDEEISAAGFDMLEEYFEKPDEDETHSLIMK